MKNGLILVILVLSMNISAQMLNVGNLPVFSVGKTQFTSGKIDTMVQALARQQFKGRQVPPQAINQMKQMVVVHGQMLMETGSQIKMTLVLMLLEFLKKVVVLLSQLI